MLWNVTSTTARDVRTGGSAEDASLDGHPESRVCPVNSVCPSRPRQRHPSCTSSWSSPAAAVRNTRPGRSPGAAAARRSGRSYGRRVARLASRHRRRRGDERDGGSNLRSGQSRESRSSVCDVLSLSRRDSHLDAGRERSPVAGRRSRRSVEWGLGVGSTPVRVHRISPRASSTGRSEERFGSFTRSCRAICAPSPTILVETHLHLRSVVSPRYREGGSPSSTAGRISMLARAPLRESGSPDAAEERTGDPAPSPSRPSSVRLPARWRRPRGCSTGPPGRRRRRPCSPSRRRMLASSS